ncbi:perlucin-like protein [Ruditapes philippinarum]|uniref:perlucin-like protein n=1 Tax=Ruditapes philippinarum TaxID=129788 RepID=UPI00295B586B|nr:perlucin-like protein [Ruditapes philippinarum]XP_060562390.1 perlucin-like protein [Ruditapes philippinarum]XP_060562391.1 perlucin-like protein [Ruditapes philippinarum]XP_060562392.1 perlucin-like protein [Ruditapes philippinarum]
MKPAVAFLFAVTSLVLGVNVRACCNDGWIPYQGHCYHIGYGTFLTFSEARTYCDDRGAYLVRFDNIVENNFLADILRKTKAEHTWMGLTDQHHEGIWKWFDTNEHATFSDWGAGEPNNYNNAEDCVHFDVSSNYKWNDVSCGSKMLPLCKIELQ